MNEIRPGGFNLMPLVVKNLLIINGLVYIIGVVAYLKFGIDLNAYLGLYYPESNHFQPFQLVTHFFSHGIIDPAGGLIFSHILLNMFSLWMFGSSVENYLGSKRFLIFYFVTALGAASIHMSIKAYEINSVKNKVEAFLEAPDVEHFESFTYSSATSNYRPPFEEVLNYWSDNPNNQEVKSQAIALANELVEVKIDNSIVVGASGAVYGILLAFGMLFPNALLYIYFLFPVKAKYAVIGFGLLSLFDALRNEPGDNIAHFAHLGGMLFGFIMIRYWKKRGY
jgi:membrane associated rhomboid family serine protease